MAAGRSAEEEAFESPPDGGRLRRGLCGPPVVTVLFAIASGFLLTSAMVTGREAAEAQQSRHGELVALVEARHEHVEALEGQLDGLRDRVADVEAAADPAGGLRSEVRDAERSAGLTGLAGPGVTLTLGDADVPCPTGEAADCRIRDRDLQAAVNTLFAGGAEGIAVNGERIVATTAIRNAGASVLVNYHVLGPPFEVEAIGDPAALEAHVEDSQLGHDFEVWTERYGLRFDLDADDEVRLPAYGGSVRTREARVRAEQATATPDDASPRTDPLGPDGLRWLDDGREPGGAVVPETEDLP